MNGVVGADRTGLSQGGATKGGAPFALVGRQALGAKEMGALAKSQGVHSNILKKILNFYLKGSITNKTFFPETYPE